MERFFLPKNSFHSNPARPEAVFGISVEEAYNYLG
jgi:hypothetical protein